MSYNRNKDQHEDFIRREYRKHNPRSIWRVIGYSILAAMVLFGFGYILFAGHGA